MITTIEEATKLLKMSEQAIWLKGLEKERKEAEEIAIKSLETIQRIDDVLNVEGMTEIDVLDEIMEAVSEFKYDCEVSE